MPNIVRGAFFEGGLRDSDSWAAVSDRSELEALEPRMPVIVPLAFWRANEDLLNAREGALGLLLRPDDDVFELREKTARFALISIQFPTFTDGRGFSAARLLRERLGFRGELRAVGDILPDQVFYLLRCGFDAFAPHDEAHIENMLRAYTTFREAYQSSVERPMPLFRRRAQALSDLERT